MGNTYPAGFWPLLQDKLHIIKFLWASKQAAREYLSSLYLPGDETSHSLPANCNGSMLVLDESSAPAACQPLVLDNVMTVRASSAPATLPPLHPPTKPLSVRPKQSTLTNREGSRSSCCCFCPRHSPTHCCGPHCSRRVIVISTASDIPAATPHHLLRPSLPASALHAGEVR